MKGRVLGMGLGLLKGTTRPPCDVSMMNTFYPHSSIPLPHSQSHSSFPVHFVTFLFTYFVNPFDIFASSVLPFHCLPSFFFVFSFSNYETHSFPFYFVIPYPSLAHPVTPKPLVFFSCLIFFAHFSLFLSLPAFLASLPLYFSCLYSFSL